MKAMFKGLDTETQLLVGIGAAVAAGCIPCLETMVSMAEQEGLDEKRLKAAAIVGQFVKEQPAVHMKEAADRLLNTHLQAGAEQVACPMESDRKEKRENCGSEQKCCG